MGRKPPKAAHVKGQYLGVALIDLVSGLPLTAYEAQDGSRVYVRAMNGQTYGIQLENYTDGFITYTVSIDGLPVAHQYVEPHETNQITSVCTGVEEGLCGTTRETLRPLMFSQPRVIPSWQPSDAHTADKEAVHEQLDKLGKMVVEVRRAVETKLAPASRILVGEEDMAEVEVSEDIGKKDAVFAVQTTFASGKTTNFMTRPRMSIYRHGELLETLTISYGTEAALRRAMPGVTMTQKKRGFVEVYGFDPREVAKKASKQSLGNWGRGKKKRNGDQQSATLEVKESATLEIKDEDEKPEPEVLIWDLTTS